MDRRDFIKITAISGTGATLASCGNPENHLIRFIPEEPLFPGIATWRPSVCPLCPAGCGIQVRVMEGEAEVSRNGESGVIRMNLAKKLEGSPAHPVSQGRICVRGQAAIQMTYHPDRIQQPLRRTGERGSGLYEPVSWEDAIGEVTAQLDALAAAGNPGALGFLTRPLRGQRQVLIDRFLEGFGAPPPIVYEVFEEDVLRRANSRSFGRDQLPTFDLAESRYVLSFGADFLGTWNSPVSQSIAYGDMRQGRAGVRAKFVQAELRMSQTGANADEWVPVRPGTEGVFALGIAHVILRDGLRRAADAGRAGTLLAGWNEGLPAYTPEAVAQRTGVDAPRIERLAREFAGNAPAVAIIGGAPLAQTNGMFQALAVNALNALVGSVGRPGGILFTPQPPAALSGSGNRRRFRDSISGIGVLLVYDANPVFGSPPGLNAAAALSGIPYIVSFGSFLDETSSLADLILPDHSFLESWVDNVPEMGTRTAVASVAAPVMRPLYLTRPMPDVLLEIGRRLARALSPALPWTSYEAMLEDAFRKLPAPLDVDAWSAAQEKGGWWDEAPSTGLPAGGPAGSAPPMALSEPQFDGDEATYPYHFLPFASQAFWDGSLAHLPWLQELPDVISTAMWSSWLEINPRTAQALGIETGDMVDVISSQGSIEVPALVSPGIAPDVVAMPVGQGHRTFTRYASGRGANPLAILATLQEPETGANAWAATRVRIVRKSGAAERGKGLVMFAGGLREHDEHGR